MSSAVLVVGTIVCLAGLLVAACTVAGLMIWRSRQQERQRRENQLLSVYHSRERRERKDH